MNNHAVNNQQRAAADNANKESANDDDPICLNCGEMLYAQRCKIICPRCGYREDCADAGLIDYDLIERRKARREAEEKHNQFSNRKDIS